MKNRSSASFHSRGNSHHERIATGVEGGAGITNSSNGSNGICSSISSSSSILFNQKPARSRTRTRIHQDRREQAIASANTITSANTSLATAAASKRATVARRSVLHRRRTKRALRLLAIPLVFLAPIVALHLELHRLLQRHGRFVHGTAPLHADAHALSSSSPSPGRLDAGEEDGSPVGPGRTDAPRIDPILVFRFPPYHTGQGIGNVVSGVLAAHLLAEEFHRTICHAPHPKDEAAIATGKDASAAGRGPHASFHKAFAWKDPAHAERCDRALGGGATRSVGNSTGAHANTHTTIVQNNYDATSEQSECRMKDILSNHEDYPIVYYEGNTYPRWPSRSSNSSNNTINNNNNNTHREERDYFHERFEPTPELRAILPWSVAPRDSNGAADEPTRATTTITGKPPSIVVHLRDGDGVHDEREGLDEETLSLLAREDFVEAARGKAGGAVFLVTNRIDWYARFPNWSNPGWTSEIHHSAMDAIRWGSSSEKPAHHQRNKDREALQLWADWYTLLVADRIYHTHSDFSRSAARWNERTKSWTIRGTTSAAGGTEEGQERAESHRLWLQPDLEEKGSGETRGRKNGTPRLVDRTGDGLWFCGGAATASLREQLHRKEKHDRQLLDLVRRRQRMRTGASHW
ncbi:unnamed protein product [Pseudo-nitzschia multistriata]|uniref:Uncharacterized protein n=1 Tax=Pseudo-nitzschia multistriata TaxID=183589 RepID=A0A448YWX9_9STRA|nr:unnamed protein product [Pseudo-nitzschia multistriata]